ncbi:MAG: isochorismatase family protein [Desulfobacter sp.]
MIDEKEKGTAIVVVDVQGDFTACRQGALAVAGTDRAYLDTVDAETRRLKGLGYPVFATQDWHPGDHISFFSNHENKSAFDTLAMDDRVQVLWPPHCIQDTENAEVLLDNSLFDAIVKKGTDTGYDSYSGFFDDGGQETGLEQMLKSRAIKKLIVYGLATDYCVRATVMDARALGFDVVLVASLCRGVAEETTRAALEEMAAAGVLIL